jgi:hypothetical protein
LPGLSDDGAFDPDMREALANATQRYGLTVSLPSVATLQATRSTSGDRLLRVAELSDSAVQRTTKTDKAIASLTHIFANWDIRSVLIDVCFRGVRPLLTQSGHGILARALFEPSPQSNTRPEICVPPILPHIGRDSGVTVVVKYGASMCNRAISSVFWATCRKRNDRLGLKSLEP